MMFADSGTFDWIIFSDVECLFLDIL